MAQYYAYLSQARAKATFTSVTFNGVNQWGELDGTSDLNVDHLVMSLQIKLLTLPTIATTVWRKGSSWTSHSILFKFNNNDRYAYSPYLTSVSTHVNNYSSIIAANEVKRLITGYDTLMRRLYMYENGALTSNAQMGDTQPEPLKNTDFWNMAGGAGFSYFLHASVSEPCLFSKVMTAQDAAGIPNALLRFLADGTPVPGLLCYFPYAPRIVSGQAWTHEWDDVVGGKVMRLYNNPTFTTYERELS